MDILPTPKRYREWERFNQYLFSALLHEQKVIQKIPETLNN